jgi:predicted enzyme related to lactoylglutathione lyase
VKDALNWFEIPAADLDRAEKFYGTVLGVEFVPGPGMGDARMAMFPSQGGVGGALLEAEGWTPGTAGSVIYLNCDGDLETPLSRVEAAGGKILVPITDIGENGRYAFIMDSEGNRVGLHASPA